MKLKQTRIGLDRQSHYIKKYIYTYMEDYTEFKQALQKNYRNMESKCEDVSLVKSTISGINNMVM